MSSGAQSLPTSMQNERLRFDEWWMMRPEVATITLGEAVRKRRKLLGLTQEALARSAGCGLVFVYHLERGKVTLRLDKLLAILQVLGLELSVSSRDGRSSHDGDLIQQPAHTSR